MRAFGTIGVNIVIGCEIKADTIPAVVFDLIDKGLELLQTEPDGTCIGQLLVVARYKTCPWGIICYHTVSFIDRYFGLSCCLLHTIGSKK